VDSSASKISKLNTMLHPARRCVLALERLGIIQEAKWYASLLDCFLFLAWPDNRAWPKVVHPQRSQVLSHQVLLRQLPHRLVAHQ
jgi:hypothetical protein